MGTFSVAGNYDTLFYGSDFYGEVQVEATRNEWNNTFTISVTGARAWSKYSLNKAISFSCWLGNNSAGSGKVNGSCTIPASGSNSHTGWNPSSGYTSVSGCTKSFNGNASNGTCPTVYLYFKFDTGSVYYISKDTYVSAQSTYSANISSTAQIKAGGANDCSSPSFVAGYPIVTPTSATSANYRVKVSTGGSTYVTAINNTTAQKSHSTSSYANNTEISGSIETKSQVNSITITSTKENNGLSVSKTLDVDCSRPDVIFSITPTGLNTADGYIKCSNYDFKYQVDNGSFSSNSTPKNTNATYTFTNLRNEKQTHKAKTRRSDVDIDSDEASYEVDMRLPTIANTSIVANTTTSGTLTYKCDLSGTAYWYDNNNNLLNSWAVTGSNNAQTRIVTLLQNESGNTTYRLKIARDIYDVLYSQTIVYANTQTNTATIKNVDAVGTSMTLYVDISGSVKYHPSAELYNIQYYSKGSDTVYGVPQSDGTYKFEFKNLPMNVLMTLRLNIVNGNSGLTSVIERNQTVEGKDLICRGVVYINTDGTPDGWKMGVVYVNTTGTYEGWKGGAPYINTDGTFQGWTFGKLNE